MWLWTLLTSMEGTCDCSSSYVNIASNVFSRTDAILYNIYDSNWQCLLLCICISVYSCTCLFYGYSLSTSTTFEHPTVELVVTVHYIQSSTCYVWTANSGTSCNSPLDQAQHVTFEHPIVELVVTVHWTKLNMLRLNIQQWN